MRWLAVVVMVAWTTMAQADPSPRIEDAIARAAQLGKPVVAEFSATWCMPCRVFEKEVLTDPSVVKALQDVEFVRYDIDASPGDDAARTYNVSGVPTVLVIELDGHVSVRTIGLGATRKLRVAWFLELLANATRARTSIAELDAAIVKAPADTTLRIQLAEHYRAIGKSDEAITAYQAIVDLPGVDRGVAAAAASAADDLQLAVTRTQLTIDAAIEFSTRFPESPLTTGRLAIAIVSRRVSATVLGPLVRAHLANIPATARPDAIRIALLARFTKDASDAIASWRQLRPESSGARLLAVELALHVGGGIGARTAFDQVCAAPALDIELWCYTLGNVLDGKHLVPAIARLRGQAERVIAGLVSPGAPPDGFGLDALTSEDDRPFGNALARAFRDAERTCGELASVGRVGIAMQLAPGGGRPLAVRIMNASKSLDRCLHERLLTASLPQPPERLNGRFYASLGTQRSEAGARVEERTRSTLPRGPALGSGAVMFMYNRSGALGSLGVGSHGVLDLARVADLRLLAGWQLESGIADEGSTSYAARALGGLGVTPARGVAFAALAGIGVVRFGDTAPRAGEIPFELRLRFPIRSARAHVWLQATRLFGTTAPIDRMSDFLVGDELSFGFGTSVAAAGTRLFIGAVVEQRAAGTSAFIFAGIPISDYF